MLIEQQVVQEAKAQFEVGVETVRRDGQHFGLWCLRGVGGNEIVPTSIK